MSEMDPEIQAMNYILQLEPSLRARVLKWANERFGSVVTTTQATVASTPTVEAAPARKRGRPRKVKGAAPKVQKQARKAKATRTTKAAKPVVAHKPKATSEARLANRLLVWEGVKATLNPEGKTDRKAVVTFLKKKNTHKNVVGNISAYLTTLERQKVIQVNAGVIAPVQVNAGVIAPVQG